MYLVFLRLVSGSIHPSLKVLYCIPPPGSDPPQSIVLVLYPKIPNTIQNTLPISIKYPGLATAPVSLWPPAFFLPTPFYMCQRCGLCVPSLQLLAAHEHAAHPPPTPEVKEEVLPAEAGARAEEASGTAAPIVEEDRPLSPSRVFKCR